VTAYDRLVDRLTADGFKVKAKDGNARSQCPAHEDRAPSLSLMKIEGQVLVHCHAGCQTEDVTAALNLTMRDLFDEPTGASYHYTDRTGTVLRTVSRSPDKRFTQSGQTKGASTLYRLREVLAAVADDQVVYVVEGEKDVHALEAVGAVATTAPMGANNWSKVDASPLHGGKVVVVVDGDAAGHKWASAVYDSLDGMVQSLTFTTARTGKDAADHIAAGHALDELEPLELDTDVAPRRARVTWASQIEPEPVTWAWKEGDAGRIPSGSLSMAAGREGTGKSSFGMWLAAQITRGNLPGSFYGKPRKVLYVAVEDSWKHTLVPRLVAVGADLSKVGRFEVVSVDDEEMLLSLPHDNALLEREVRFHDVALVVLDPLMSVIGERIDTHREREVRSALDPLAKIADRTGSVFLGIAHFNKGNGTDAASLITGSGAFKNVPRSVFGFARDDSDDTGGRVMTQVKNSLGRDDLPSLSYVMETAVIETRLGPAETGRFVFTGVSERSVADVIRDGRGDPEDHDERKEVAAWLVDHLATNGGEVPAKDVYRAGNAEGYSKDMLKRSKGKRVRSTKVGDGWVWQLEEAAPTVPDEAKGAPREQGSKGQKSAPLLPCPLPSQTPALPAPSQRHCPDCDTEVPAGHVRCQPCFLRATRKSA